MIQDKIFFDEKDPTGVSYNTPFTVYGSYEGRLWSKTPSGTIKYYTQNSDLSVYATTGSNSFNGNQTVTGSLTVTGGITGTTTTASYVEYAGVANKPTLVSSSAQIVEYNVFATTGSNQFDGSQAITGSLTVTGQVVAQTLNVQQVTSSIVFSSGSNIFGNDLGNTQQFTGSVSVTGSLTVNGSGLVPYTGATADVNLGNFDVLSRYLNAEGSPGLGGVLNIKQDAVYLPKGNGYSSIASSFTAFDFYGYTGASTYKNFSFRFDGLTDNTLRIYTLPNEAGTLALTSNLSAYLPLTGGTLTGALNGTSASFTGAVQIVGSGNSEVDVLTISNFEQDDSGDETANIYFQLTRSYTNSLSPAGYIKVGKERAWNVSGGRQSFMSFLTRNGADDPTERMRITSGGNVGIGTDNPTANGLMIEKTGNHLFLRASSAAAGKYWNFDITSANQLYITNNSFTQYFTMTDAGNFGIGTASPSARLHVANSAGGVVAFLQSTATNGEPSLNLEGRNSSGTVRNAVFKYDNADLLRIGTSSPISFRFETNDVERMSIASNGIISTNGYAYGGTLGFAFNTSGYAQIGINTDSVGSEVILINNLTSGGSAGVLQYRTTGTIEGTLEGTSSGLAISNVSDYRKKTDIRDLNNSLSTINNLQPRIYKYKEGLGKPTDKDFVGFIAHELQEILPDSVTGIKDAVYTQEDIDGGAVGFNVGDAKYQTVSYTSNEMITYLVGAIQELKSENDTLKSILQRNNIS